MEIDTTLNNLLLPFMPTYQNEIGTKKPKKGLTTVECSDAILRPFRQQRPFLVSEDSETTEIQANCGFVVTTAGVTLTLNDAFFSGCEVTVANLSDGDIVVKGGVSGLNGSLSGISLAKGVYVKFVFFNGWRSLTGGNGQGYVTVPVASTIENVSDTTELIVRDSLGVLLKSAMKTLWTYIKGKVSSEGNSATATKLAAARTINIQDSAGTNTGTGASFDGSGNATIKLPATIKANITGNCSGSSGSCTGNSATANKVKTVSNATNATCYLTFVDSNNSSTADESVYTDPGITYNPSTNSLTVSGNIKGGQIVVPTTKPSSPVSGSIWLARY